MTHGKIRCSAFAVIDVILVCLNLSENDHMGIYYHSTCFICADISWQSELLLPQTIRWVTEGFFVFCLVLVLLWSNEACRRNKQKYEGRISQFNMSHDSQRCTHASMQESMIASQHLVWMSIETSFQFWWLQLPSIAMNQRKNMR